MHLSAQCTSYGTSCRICYTPEDVAITLQWKGTNTETGGIPKTLGDKHRGSWHAQNIAASPAATTAAVAAEAASDGGAATSAATIAAHPANNTLCNF